MLRIALGACAVLVSLPVGAADRWEVRGDNGPFTNNELQPGVVQEGHDLEETPRGPDEDWYKVRGDQVRSFEARVFGGGVVWKYPACPDCADFDLVTPDGTVLTPGDSFTTLGPTARSVRWMGGPPVQQFLRVKPNKSGVAGSASEKYDIMVVDTTLYLPRFNNSGTQRTVVIVQNTLDQGTQGQLTFYETSGLVIHGFGFNLLPHGSFVLDTSSVGQLLGRSGSAVLAHTAGRSGLVAKAVAMDPVTGFTFDTPFIGIER
jgi:hypothetical protein